MVSSLHSARADQACLLLPLLGTWELLCPSCQAGYHFGNPLKYVSSFLRFWGFCKSSKPRSFLKLSLLRILIGIYFVFFSISDIGENNYLVKTCLIWYVFHFQSTSRFDFIVSAADGSSLLIKQNPTGYALV
uniref:Uncharacterized protein n=1 Tax=Chelonoidis abingdonii TaxID=106734 RepID=A0A8C0H3A8_CHEAB